MTALDRERFHFTSFPIKGELVLGSGRSGFDSNPETNIIPIGNAADHAAGVISGSSPCLVGDGIIMIHTIHAGCGEPSSKFYTANSRDGKHSMAYQRLC